jgi:hypothetical protein
MKPAACSGSICLRAGGVTGFGNPARRVAGLPILRPSVPTLQSTSGQGPAAADAVPGRAARQCRWPLSNSLRAYSAESGWSENTPSTPSA